MLQGLLLEYIGSLLICATILYTNANPILVGLSYTSALYIGKDKTNTFFSPLSVIAQGMLGRITLYDALKLLAVQVAAALSVALTYMYVA